MYIRILYLCFRIYCFLFRPVRVGVRVMMIKDDQVLLVRQTYIPGWFMPGGGLKRGETLEQAARREVREEVGAELGDIQFMGAYTGFKEWKTDHNIVFLCRDFTLNGGHDREIAEAHFFHLNELPEGLWPGHRRRLEEVQAGMENPQFGEW
jgi:8-oxo-dGTP pyrophosphatase MutT (NUDIX family)